jgi:hypothetical protein
MVKALRLLLPFICALISFSLSGQDKTYAPRTGSAGSKGSSKILLVPYDPRMFISDVNRELEEAHQTHINEIRTILRESLSQIVAVELGKSHSVTDLLNDGDEGMESDIRRVYSAITWDYIPVSAPDSSGKKKARRAEEQAGRGVNIEAGELKTYYDNRDRFMDARIVDTKIIDYIKNKYNSDYILLLNELDIRIKKGAAAGVSNGARQVKVHFTLFDRKGNRIGGTAAYFDYSGKTTDVFNLMKSGFGKVASDIHAMIGSTPVLPKEENVK